MDFVVVEVLQRELRIGQHCGHGIGGCHQQAFVAALEIHGPGLAEAQPTENRQAARARPVLAGQQHRRCAVGVMDFPRTIHDFGGFPKELYNVRYNAPGNADLATFISREVRTTTIGLDHSWGLDHGAWSVIKHIYPKADIPVLELSLDYTKDPFYHYSLAKQLAFLRTKGVLIIGSGNIVHNLSKVAWNKLDEPNFAYDWALEARTIINTAIIDGNHKKLCEYQTLGSAISLAIPSPEHFLPLLYILALQQKSEPLMLFNDKALGGSLTMTSLKIG